MPHGRPLKSPCIFWTGKLDKDGYGKTQGTLAHRIAFVKAGGTLIKGLEIDHLCEVRNCINPEHLEQVTHLENMFRSNTVARRRKLQKFCSKGHEFDEKNTYVTSRGRRQCRKCNVIAVVKYQRKVKTA